MFCPECGTQNADHAKFCISCGYQIRNAGGGIPPQQFAAPASGGSKTNYLVVFGGVLALLVIAGLVAFIVFRGSSGSAQDGAPTPRVKNTNTSNTVASNAQTVSNTTNTANTTTAAPTSTPVVTAANPAPQATAKPVKKPADCDGKCYRVYDQCMADYRQDPDPETLCRAKQRACLGKCS